MTDRELMQQALDALSMAVEPKKGKVYAFEFQPIDCVAMHFKAIEALRARLAGWEKLNMNDHKEGDLGIGTVKWDASAPLVVHPHPAFQATQPQQHSEQWWRHEVSNAWAEGYEKGRASVKQPEQEPVACPYCHYSHTLGAVFFDQNCAGCVKRMTAPPQRECEICGKVAKP